MFDMIMKGKKLSEIFLVIPSHGPGALAHGGDGLDRLHLHHPVRGHREVHLCDQAGDYYVGRLF